MDFSADDPAPLSWTREQAEGLIAWAERSRQAQGFAWLDDTGRQRTEQGVQTWITSRTTHVSALCSREGGGAAAELAEHGVHSLRESLRDPEHGGWFSTVAFDGAPADTGKAAYQHAFVLLAASTAASAGTPGADQLLGDAAATVLDRFWDAAAGLSVESFDRAFAHGEDYRGANSNMHMVEAFLAAGTATGDPAWARRALGISDFLIRGEAAAHGYRLPEHFTPQWEVVLEYNRDRPGDPFRPYGWTPGHSLEWARLLLHVEAAVEEPPGWLLPAAEALFSTAVEAAWARDGADGFCYTLDWDDRPVIHERMHWVATEAVAAAHALHTRTGESAYAELARRWWVHVRTCFVDGDRNWRHEIDSRHRPSTTVWSGRPDVYHAYTALAFAAGTPIPGYAVLGAGAPSEGSTNA
ncbi:AGE family epimerase/isomerase [Streptomonospora wellingtoniae]|uniref:AGE family epimerase/isomerase n=1 Tax=Streptomonospora wellingtoniae TaxID=3075544 RepID=A0ABU2KQ84_9ACTN|nr:AGE family epimerase/isomerase [Streptomonospora sp. DSM 45055]MDT0301437.1 AGE family epimerase/isomerase [Streptomonospora sp. DSM 45055]